MPTKTDVYRRLVNWGRWFRDIDPQGRCRSIEHRYVRGKDEAALLQAEEDQRKKSVPTPEMRDAEIVNAAWKQCMPSNKRMLQAAFCFGKVSDKFICDRLGIQPQALALRYGKAVNEIAHRLDKSEIRPTIRVIRSPQSRSRADTPNPADVAETEEPV